MNTTLQTALNHRSIREFTDQAIDESTFQQLIEAGQMASSSNFLQMVSIIRVKDPAQRQAIREVCGSAYGMGQPYVENCAEFLVFCADTTRHTALLPEAQTDWTEVLLIGAIDTGILAQNILLCAESQGLGGVFIGSLRNDMAKIIKILDLPQGVVPLVGMCLGYPAQAPLQRPRLPQSLVLSTDHYQPSDLTQLLSYNAQIAEYYQARGGKSADWLTSIKATLDKPVRPDILEVLQGQGFAKR